MRLRAALPVAKASWTPCVYQSKLEHPPHCETVIFCTYNTRKTTSRHGNELSFRDLSSLEEHRSPTDANSCVARVDTLVNEVSFPDESSDNIVAQVKVMKEDDQKSHLEQQHGSPDHGDGVRVNYNCRCSEVQAENQKLCSHSASDGPASVEYHNHKEFQDSHHNSQLIGSSQGKPRDIPVLWTPQHGQQSSFLASVQPVGSVGRGQLKRTFQQFLSKKGVPLSGVGHPEKESAIDLSADSKFCSGGIEGKTESSHQITCETETEINPIVETDKTESHVIQSPSDMSSPGSCFLFRLLEARQCTCASREQGSRLAERATVSEETADSMEQNIASLQRSIEHLEVRNHNVYISLVVGFQLLLSRWS